MIYEEKKALIIQSIIEAKKLEVAGKNPTLYIHKVSLKEIDQQELIDILIQFGQLGKLKIGKTYLGTLKVFEKAFEDLNIKPDYKIELENIDIKYFEDEYLKYRSHLTISNENLNNEFFLVYSNDRKILINGKIEIAKPDLNSENDLIFKYLYDNRNKTILKSDIKEYLGGHISKSFNKILDNLGFSRGIRSAFIDMNKWTIKLKSPVKL